ncbi:MAG: hypothetical protein N3I86_01320 [Verrucomicrobiae bacterium]|nr:hypothetical protein [Verrucomicrobiae bacterium]MDW8308695.1 hypothetical protein [Verrucomicrobiales bacterium]
MPTCWTKLKQLALAEIEATLEALPPPLRERERWDIARAYHAFQ